MKIFGWIVATPFILLIVWLIGRLLFCGPDEGIRKVTDPLANSILEYVNENGKPDSLLDIKTLPYKIQECKKSERVRESITDISEKESCVFKHNKQQYSVTIDNHIGKYTFSLYIYNYKKNTEVQYYFDQRKLNSYEEILKIRNSYVRSIHKPFLCKSGYLSIK